jgi:hypothetical protein
MILLGEYQSVPHEVTVKCPGESVQDALDNAPDFGGFTIIVDGVCTECVTINRDDVTLRGSSPVAGLQTTSPDCFAVLELRARNTRLQQLTITGGHQGILAHKNASFSAGDLQISGALDTGISVDSNSVGDLHNSSVESFANRGIVAIRGGVLQMFGGSVDNADAGNTGIQASYGGNVTLYNGAAVRNIGFIAVVADQGGSIEITNGIVENSHFGVFAANGHVSLRDGTIVQGCEQGGVGANEGGTFSLSGVTVRNIEGHAVSGRSGARFSIGGSFIYQNTDADAISLGGGSTASIGGTEIINNVGNGIGIGATSVVTFFVDDNDITVDKGFGIVCYDPVFGGIVGDPGTINGASEDIKDCQQLFP